MAIATIREAIDAIQEGRMVILVDDEDRENEGDLVIAAEKVTGEAIQFMAREARGLICLTLTDEQCDNLGIEPMTRSNQAPLGTAFTNSIDAANLDEPGVSSHARAKTILASVEDDASAASIVSPGFVFPLRARAGGVLVRAGQTEGSVDLTRLAGMKPAGVICEIMKEDGTMARMPELEEFAEQYNIPLVTVADLIEFRMHQESLIRPVGQAKLPTEYGEFDILAYENDLDEATHLVLRHGEISPDKPTLVRVHRSNLLSDVFGLDLARSRHKLDLAMKRIVQEGAGVILYLRGEMNALESGESLQHYCNEKTSPLSGQRTPHGMKMDFRDYGVGAQILADVGARKLRVLTNTPLFFKGLAGFGLEITESVPLEETN